MLIEKVMINTPNKTNDATSTYTIFKAARKVTLKEVEDWCYENLTEGCHCSYDCCGHWFGGPRKVKRLKGRKFAVTCGYARNY